MRRRGAEPGSALTAGVAGVRRGAGVAVGGQVRGRRRRGVGVWGSEPRGRKLKVGGRGAGKVRDVGSGAWLRARPWALWFGVTALRSLPPISVRRPWLWDPRTPLALGRTPGFLGHFHYPPPHLHQLLNLGSQIKSDAPSTQASPFQTLTPGSTTHGHPLPPNPFPVGVSFFLVSFIFSDLTFLPLRTPFSGS